MTRLTVGVQAGHFLYKAITQVIHNDVPHGHDIELPRLLKRQGPNKSKQTVLTLYAIADEQKLIEKRPVYVAANLLRIPFMNADSMDVVHMAQKFELFHIQNGNAFSKLKVRSLKK